MLPRGLAGILAEMAEIMVLWGRPAGPAGEAVQARPYQLIL